MYKFSKIIFAYYLLFLFWGILFKFDITHTINTAHLFPSRSLNVSPFDASGGRLEILFNVLIFIPFGFFYGPLFRTKLSWKMGVNLPCQSFCRNSSIYFRHRSHRYNRHHHKYLWWFDRTIALSCFPEKRKKTRCNKHVFWWLSSLFYFHSFTSLKRADVTQLFLFEHTQWKTADGEFLFLPH